MTSILIKLNQTLQQLERSFFLLFRQNYPPSFPALLNLELSNNNTTTNNNKFSLKELIGDGIFWAVPRNRRTIERRLQRKFGNPEYVWKMLVPKTNLRVCNNCGHDHEVGVLCPHCYAKVKLETQQIQEKIEKELGLNPIEDDVIVLYDGEKNDQPAEFWKGKRIIEMEKPRPMWFSKNLLQKTTQQPATTKEIKPNDLG